MSQRTPHEKMIEGKKYEVFMLPPMQSFDLLLDVSAMLGPAIGPIVDKLFSQAKGENKDLSGMMDMVVADDFFTRACSALFEKLNKKVLHDVILALKDHSMVDGKPLSPIFDAHFQGKLDELFRWLVFGMQVQWGKSFGALFDAISARGLRAQVAETEFPSPSTLIG